MKFLLSFSLRDCPRGMHTLLNLFIAAALSFGCAEQESIEADKREEGDPDDKGIYIRVDESTNSHGRSTSKQLNFFTELISKHMEEEEFKTIASESEISFKVVPSDSQNVIKEEVKTAGSYNWPLDFPSDGAYMVEITLAHPSDKKITPGENWKKEIVVDTVAPDFFISASTEPKPETGERAIKVNITTEDKDALSCRVNVLDGSSEPVNVSKVVDTSPSTAGAIDELIVPKEVQAKNLVLEVSCADKAGLLKAQSIVATADESSLQLAAELDVEVHPLGKLISDAATASPRSFSNGTLKIIPKIVSNKGGEASLEFVNQIKNRIKIAITEGPVTEVPKLSDAVGFKEYLYDSSLVYEARATLLEQKSLYVHLLLAGSIEKVGEVPAFRLVNSSKIDVYFDRVAPEVSFHKQLTKPIEARNTETLKFVFSLSGSGAPIQGPGQLQCSVDGLTWSLASVKTSIKIEDTQLVEKGGAWQIEYAYNFSEELPIRFKFVGKDLADNTFETEISPKLVYADLSAMRASQLGSCLLDDNSEGAGLLMYSASKFFCPADGNKRKVFMAIENKGSVALFQESDVSLGGLFRAGSLADSYFTVNVSQYLEGETLFFEAELPETFATEESVVAYFDSQEEYQDGVPKSENQNRWCHAYGSSLDGRPQIAIEQSLAAQITSPWCSP